MLAAVALAAVVAVLVVVVNVLGDPGATDDDTADGRPPADISGGTVSPRDDTSPVEVATPPVTPEADATCPALMSSLPVELAGERSRPVVSESPYAYAWGDPASVLVCGVPVPPGLQPDSFVIGINGVDWFVDTTDPAFYVYTTVGRVLPVEVRVPSEQDSALVTALGPLVSAAVPVA